MLRDSIDGDESGFCGCDDGGATINGEGEDAYLAEREAFLEGGPILRVFRVGWTVPIHDIIVGRILSVRDADLGSFHIICVCLSLFLATGCFRRGGLEAALLVRIRQQSRLKEMEVYLAKRRFSQSGRHS